MPLTTCGRGCKDSWDVRACCDPWSDGVKDGNTMEQLRACPKRVDTMVFYLDNNNVEDAEAWLDEFKFSVDDTDKMVSQYHGDEVAHFRLFFV